MEKKTGTRKSTKSAAPERESGRIIRSEYSELMQKSYIDYAMSVIVSRALPDVRDGLKPVQRRTLYDMNELGIRSDRPFRKCARIVGDTMGKYHPHGDSSIYDALVVMAQDFKKGLPLVDGHGNFGTIEGDGAAAMRYTEARLQKITEEAFLQDLDKDVIDFMPNFDETEKEPTVLPVKIPNFLINGSEGIAVGMATSTPPHNLGEVLDAQIAYLDHPEMTSRQLMRYIKGPDFPTGGMVINGDELSEVYETGSGRIRIRGKVEVEKGPAGHTNLVITEIPYTMIGTGIGKFLSDVAALAENKQTSDIVDITNQSSKEGIRIVIELKRGADVEYFKGLLYKKTRLEDTFGVNMLAIHDGRPEVMSLAQIMQACTDFQYETARRKYTNLLAREREKSEVQEGLIRACNVIDLIIEILRGSKTKEMAKKCLVEGVTDGIHFRNRASKKMAATLQFTPRQADAILEMRLYRLIGLEIDALMKEHEATMANIYRYEDILEERDSMTTVIRDELLDLKKKYAVARRTQITQVKEEAFQLRSAEQAREVYFVMDRFGYAKTMEKSLYERNAEAAQESFRFHFPMQSDGRICLFTDTGMLHIVKAADLPAGKLRDKGVPIDNIGNYDSAKEGIVCVLPMDAVKAGQVVFVTRKGYVKAVEGAELDSARKTVAGTKLDEGDVLILADLIGERKKVALQSASGFVLKFPVSDLPVQKKTARGNQGMALGKTDTLENAWLLDDAKSFVVTVHEKTIDLSAMQTKKRGSKGTKKL